MTRPARYTGRRHDRTTQWAGPRPPTLPQECRRAERGDRRSALVAPLLAGAGRVVATRRHLARHLAWLAPAFVFAVDLVLARYNLPLAGAALVDEPAHAVTALVGLGALGWRLTRPVAVGTLLGAVLIYIDHVPLVLGWDVLTEGTIRPYTHSLLTVGVVGLAGWWLTERSRRIALGAAFGLAMHLVRDMATGGVPLYWPVAADRITIAYGAYAALLLVAAGLVAWREGAHRRDG